ncbi:hypothetical protein GOP96_06310 [Vibrio cholerae]|nr:hypothetical protein [Vibrio cholerae]
MSIKNKLSNIFIFIIAVIRYEFIFIIGLVCLISSIYVYFAKDMQESKMDSLNQYDKSCEINNSNQAIKDEVLHLCPENNDK